MTASAVIKRRGGDMAISLSIGGREERRRRRDSGILTYLRPLRFEPMEERALLSASVAQFHHVIYDPATGNASPQVAPLAVVSSMTPAQIRAAYGIDQIVGDG